MNDFECKGLIGSGSHRDVYAHENPGWCVKVQKRDDEHCNRNEWRIWNEFPQIRGWLVPCIALSDCGKYLIQRRGKPVRAARRRKKPNWLNDAKKAKNWVKLDGEYLCCDYGDNEVYLKLKRIYS